MEMAVLLMENMCLNSAGENSAYSGDEGKIHPLTGSPRKSSKVWGLFIRRYLRAKRLAGFLVIY